ncbi:MAG: pentapeptide repeat-containing protein [Coleofasciculaceae cyanobacterium]
MDVKELLARYEAGERDFCEINLSGADLSYADLCGADLSHSNLRGANLSAAKLSGTNLFFADLSNTDLRAAYLSGAYLSNADLSASNLFGAKLFCACLLDVNLRDANLCDSELAGVNLVYADLTNTNLTNADLSYANLYLTNFTNATLTGAKLDGTILAYQKIAEQLQQENQTLTEKVKLLEEKLAKQKQTQDLNTASNQGINGRYKWNNFYFRSKTEMKIAEALDRTGVLFYPNSKARLNKAELRVNKESDFLVFYKGKFGILEVDGRDYHQIAADDHERDRLFKRHGIRVIERFDATRCWSAPEQVVEEFLEILSQA